MVQPAVEPVVDAARGPAYRDLADRLRALIVDGRLAPGDRLPVEPALSAQYGVSRGTVREALRVLSSQGLIETRRGVAGGSFVQRPDPEQISESLETSLGLLAGTGGMSVAQLLELRELLEVPAAGLAAVRRSDAHLTALRASVGRVPADSDVYGRNRDFHTTVLDAAGNPLLGVVTRPVFQLMQTRFLRDLAPGRFWTRVDRDHREILGHLESRDADGAREATRSHLHRLRATYTRIDRESRRSR